MIACGRTTCAARLYTSFCRTPQCVHRPRSSASLFVEKHVCSLLLSGQEGVPRFLCPPAVRDLGQTQSMVSGSVRGQDQCHNRRDMDLDRRRRPLRKTEEGVWSVLSLRLSLQCLPTCRRDTGCCLHQCALGAGAEHGVTQQPRKFQ